jgi:glucose/arabinose dehydrogenase
MTPYRVGKLLATVAVLATAAVPSTAAAQDEEPPAVGLRTIATGLTAPVALTTPGDASGRLFVTDQSGLIRVLNADGTLRPEPFLDVRSRMVNLMPGFDERGLLGLAFHPQYATNGRFFVYYNAPLRAGGPAGFNNTATISEFRVSANPNIADPASERVLLRVDKPQFNHNGGAVLFGPEDGDLYISFGDGGGGNDVGLGHVPDWFAENGGGNGQDVTQNLLGSILRIDVDSGSPYGIPPDNPFVGRDGLDEVWAYGLRNPWRMSFDSGTNDLLVGDVGQGSWEEVSIVTRGGNYGWNVKEGTHCFDAEASTVEPADCPDFVGAGHPDTGDPLIDPVIEYPQARIGGPGVAVVGGHMYRGRVLRQFRGRYLFGDWSRSFGQPNGSLFVAKPRRQGLWQMQELRVNTSANGRMNSRLLGFGEDTTGEVYALTSQNAGPSGTTGRVLKLVRPSG